jgi:adenylosuccinate lyase
LCADNQRKRSRFIFYGWINKILAILPIDNGRYGTKEMMDIFGEQKKIDYQLEIEGSAAISQSEISMISKKIGKNIFNVSMSGKITAKRIKQLEAKSDHDTAALVEALSEKCTKEARPWIHYGLTSNDLVDTSNSMQMRDALKIIESKVAKMASILAEKAVKHGKIPAVGRTHGQHASIISFGLKFANWAVEMAKHVERIEEIKKRILICKTLGVVGTGSLMGAESLEVQKRVAKRLDLYPAEVATQIVPRERYAEYVFELALIGATLEKIAIEIRNLQRTEIGEVAEQFKKGQMGSSAVPVKRNPIKSERVSSLSKLVRSQVAVAFENIPLWHERDLSNSANERFVIPTVSILVDEMLETMTKIISNLRVNEKRIMENLYITKGQIFAEFVLEALIKKGIPRFTAYKDVQRVAFEANDKRIQYRDAIKNDKAFSSKLTEKEIDSIFTPEKHLGASPIIISNVKKSVQKTIKKFI